ncbi:uncharacterized protein A4U43_C09F610 [Asparagus officinalis]|uniref:Uncharacterized protein n=1 Tax=Asparagus officinalis TaxID=4686 RepID=A0A5P1E7I6_ASPOF|nr:uncharacterized protein A4U43_C09F610 [Asparagus officinalis]
MQFPVRGGRGRGNGQGDVRGYGADIGSGNWAAGGNDIRIRNVLGHISDGMQIGSNNFSETDNVVRIGQSGNSNRPAQCRDDDDTVEVTGCWGALVAPIKKQLRRNSKS